MDEPTNLIDVFMPEDLCARCADAEPLTKFSLILTPSPSSTWRPARVSFCSSECRKVFVDAWQALGGVDSNS